MKPRFLSDYDLNGEIVDGLRRREPEVDLESAHEAGLEGAPDPAVLQRAADGGRILLTHDHRTMPQHFADYISRRPSPGVFIIPQHLNVLVAIDELLLIWSASESEEWIDRILYLPI